MTLPGLHWCAALGALGSHAYIVEELQHSALAAMCRLANWSVIRFSTLAVSMLNASVAGVLGVSGRTDSWIVGQARLSQASRHGLTTPGLLPVQRRSSRMPVISSRDATKTAPPGWRETHDWWLSSMNWQQAAQ